MSPKRYTNEIHQKDKEDKGNEGGKYQLNQYKSINNIYNIKVSIKLQVSATIKMFKSKTKLQLQKHMNLNYKLKYLNLEIK